MHSEKFRPIFVKKKDMKTSTDILLADLIERTRKHLNAAEHYKSLTDEQLNWRQAEGSWSVLECLEHLNLYGDFYLPEIDRRISNSKFTAEQQFKSGLLGNYFAQSMLPKDKLNRMKTFKDKNPLGSQLDKRTVNRFIEQQKKMLNLLERARKVSLNRTKTSISIPFPIRFKLGDTFRFVIYHNQRHIAQAEQVIEAERW